ncbi:MAG: MBOAT family protein [Bacteroidia bacterium]|nr:MBOAT family protein [Bacteroidia bacterium]
MLFNSLAFILFLLVVFTFYWLLKPNWRWVFLLIASYTFYAGWGYWYVLLLFITSTIDYWAALKIHKSKNEKHRKRFLALSVIANLSVLGAFKYFVFFYNSGASLANTLSGSSFHLLNDIIIPVGLSFYTFQSISYTIDVYRKEVIPEKNLLKFSLFVSFFPQLVAGPIERFNNLMPQLLSKKIFSESMFTSGLKIMLWGFFKKIVIADRLALIVDPLFADVNSYHGFTLLFGGFLFVVQVYCDFSGYSDIATGVSKWFGINLSLNWRRPLLSKSLIEFWKRNHISITSWFRSYLYIPLGGNKCSYQRWLLNIFLVFLISGLWHGANFTFIIWGAMHGLVYIVELIIAKKNMNFKMPAILMHFYLLLFHTFSLIAFRAISASDLGIIYNSIFFKFNALSSFNEIRNLADAFTLLVNGLLITFLFLKEMQEEYVWFSKQEKLQTILRPAFYISIIVVLFLLGNFNSNQFIYFRF